MVPDALATLRRQDINNHDIDWVKLLTPGLIPGMISIIYGMSVWRNDIKCKYMFLFPLKNLARKELITTAHREPMMLYLCGSLYVEFKGGWHNT